MKKIALSGGFHNMPEIRAMISDNDYEDLKAGKIRLRDALSEGQQKRLDRYFCGVSDCYCGGLDRADIDFE